MRSIAHARALKVAAVYGGVSIGRQQREASRAHILVATPGRLEDLLARNALTLSHVRILVLDEADRMLDMGFKPAVDRIVRQCPDDRQTLFFSATLEGEAGRVAQTFTRNAVRHDNTPAQHTAPDIEHRFVAVHAADRVAALVAQLRDERELALVFVRTKRGADRLAKRLASHGVSALAMHGNKSQSQRERALARFESGEIDTLVATDVAARGIDVDGISHVINFDPPADHDGYVHRVGRTGRAGRTGVGITLVDHTQSRDVERIATQLKLSREFHMTGLAQGGHPSGRRRQHASSRRRPARTG